MIKELNGAPNKMIVDIDMGSSDIHHPSRFIFTPILVTYIHRHAFFHEY
jgi:hypothetical protein